MTQTGFAQSASLGPRLHGDAGTTDPPGAGRFQGNLSRRRLHSGLEPGPPQSSTMALRSNTSEGATGMAKPFGQINKYFVWAKPVATNRLP